MTTGARRPAVRPFRLRAVLFDFDGTLTIPGQLDFAAIKHEVGCPPQELVLEWIEALPAGPQQDDALAALARFELAGATTSAPNEGAEDLVDDLRALGLKIGVLTRNGLAAVERALASFTRLTAGEFDVVLTRDDHVRPKPAPDGVLHAADLMGVAPGETLVVGDYVLDIIAGHTAGAVTAYVTNLGARVEGAHEAIPANADAATIGAVAPGAEAAAPGAEAGVPGAEAGVPGADGCPEGAPCDFVVHSLGGLREIVLLGLPLPEGKLPNDLLRRHLESLPATDGAVLVAAGVGEDVAALDVRGIETIVAHGDPITLASGELGRFAVLVNANDIAASGAEPRWLLTTILLPAGTTPSQALALLGELADAAAAQGVTIIGGHTEVTGAVSRPVVAATTIGVVRRSDLREKRAVRAGDRVLLTKGLAVEGAALLARELGERLRALGMSDAELNACRDLLGQVSIVPEARLAAGFAGVRAMHDVTEGGLATAVQELAAATGRTATVDIDRVPVLPEASRLCGLLGADPLGLIGSGSLLICCDPAETQALVERLAEAGIAAADIGGFGATGASAKPEESPTPGDAVEPIGDAVPTGVVIAFDRGRPVPWPEYAVDEAARILAEDGGRPV
jgi:HAD superfamily hydrolase (TIGR01509 family)